MIALLKELHDANASAKTFYLPAGLPDSCLEGTFFNLHTDDKTEPELTNSVTKSKTGAILLWGATHRYLILPPFPVTETLAFNGYHVEPLLSQLGKELIIALILVRLGESTVGVFQGEKRLTSKVGTGLVHSRHRQGGSSSQRFERHRQKQMEMFFERVCGHAREHLEPYVKQMDYVVYGGERKTLQLFRKQCNFLRAFDDRVSPRRLNVRKPRQATLEEAITEVWSSTLIEWGEG